MKAPDSKWCPGGCGKRIPANYLLCDYDWGRLPTRIQLFNVASSPHVVSPMYIDSINRIFTWIQEDQCMLQRESAKAPRESRGVLGRFAARVP
jgi:hypothetical protein